eukprot:15097232-Alexandrium_andersonii.AAC.1
MRSSSLIAHVTSCPAAPQPRSPGYSAARPSLQRATGLWARGLANPTAAKASVASPGCIESQPA